MTAEPISNGRTAAAGASPTATAVAAPSGGWQLGPEDRTQPAGRVFAMVLSAQLDDLRRHEPAVRADLAPVHLHDLRVALRRARSLNSAGKAVFPTVPRRELAAGMKALADRTAEVRDLDVLLAAIDARLDGVSPELRDDTRLLVAALQLRRSTARTTMDQALDGDGYQALLRRWQQLGAVYRVGRDEPGPLARRPTGDVVDEALMAAFQRVRAAGRTAHATDALEDWHELRKRLKRLRYLVVAFAPTYPADSMAPVVTRLRRLQNVLGRLQDHATEIELIESVGVAVGGRAALAAGALADQLHRATAEDLERCLGAWERFDQRQVRRSLRSAIAGANAATS